MMDDTGRIFSTPFGTGSEQSQVGSPSDTSGSGQNGGKIEFVQTDTASIPGFNLFNLIPKTPGIPFPNFGPAASNLFNLNESKAKYGKLFDGITAEIGKLTNPASVKTLQQTPTPPTQVSPTTDTSPTPPGVSKPSNPNAPSWSKSAKTNTSSSPTTSQPTNTLSAKGGDEKTTSDATSPGENKDEGGAHNMGNGASGASGRLVYTSPQGQQVFVWNAKEFPKEGVLKRQFDDFVMNHSSGLAAEFDLRTVPPGALLYLSHRLQNSRQIIDGAGLVYPNQQEGPGMDKLHAVIGTGGGGAVVEGAVSESDSQNRSLFERPMPGTFELYQDRGFEMSPDGYMVHYPNFSNIQPVKMKQPILIVKGQSGQSITDNDLMRYVAGLPRPFRSQDVKQKLTKHLSDVLGEKVVSYVYDPERKGYRSVQLTVPELINQSFEFPVGGG